MIFQLKSYIQFLLRSTNNHGIHSPFIYNLITNCFYNSNQKPWYKQLANYKNSLLKNKSVIMIEDFGAGSKLLQQKHRKISEIAKKAGIPLKRAKLLGRLTEFFKTKNVLEIGTSLGISTASLSLGNPESHINTLEGCSVTAKIAKDCLDNFKLKNIDIIVGNFKNTLPKVLKNQVYDLIYFDGNHQFESTINYFNQSLQHTHNDSVFIFDDIYWSKDMQKAWQFIKQHPKVTVTIDTFYWGIVFFRKEQAKEHFTIRL